MLRFTSLFCCVSHLAPCVAPSPHSPCHVLLATAAPQTVQIDIMWTAPFTDRSSEKVSHRVSRPKKISPDNDTTQYMQISPSSQYPNTGIVRTLLITINTRRKNGKCVRVRVSKSYQYQQAGEVMPGFHHSVAVLPLCRSVVPLP